MRQTKKLDEILKDLQVDTYMTSSSRAREKATKALREAIERAKPERMTPPDPRMKTDYTNGFNDGLDEYEANLLRELGRIDNPHQESGR